MASDRDNATETQQEFLACQTDIVLPSGGLARVLYPPNLTQDDAAKVYRVLRALAEEAQDDE